MGPECRAVLEANVRYPALPRDHLLHLAEQGLFFPRWTDAILQEIRRAIESGRPDLGEARMDHLVTQMRRAFDDAWIDEGYQALVTQMPIHPDDRHVLAAAVYDEASVIVTTNIRHFPVDVCARYGVQVLSPDAFLNELFRANPAGVRRVLEAHARALRRPPLTPLVVVERLDRYAPTYAQAVRDDMARSA